MNEAIKMAKTGKEWSGYCRSKKNWTIVEHFSYFVQQAANENLIGNFCYVSLIHMVVPFGGSRTIPMVRIRLPLLLLVRTESILTFDMATKYSMGVKVIHGPVRKMNLFPIHGLVDK